MSIDAAGPTDRTTLRRKPDRGAHDPATVHAILDAAFVCHLGIVDAEGRPVVLPTTYARVGRRLYVHGSPASRLLRTAKRSLDVCCTVTLVDGLVLARSAFHHSVNYRSVVVFGEAAEVTDLAEKRAALHALVEAMVPGRTAGCRPPSERELQATLVLSLDLAEASAKVRTGPPIDDADDHGLGFWAGVVPARPTFDAPQPDGAADMAGVPMPPELAAFVAGGGAAR